MTKTEQPYTRVVRGLRTVKGMSQSRLAQLSGVSVRTVRAIEAEGTNPRAGVLLRILDALDASEGDRARAMGA
ncbi:MAG: helix-turn-helix transcriptional regulator [Hyphomicrobiaceae bacterium]|nr:helix-turn-helix transcriptional regulator [Hyphomicrobiaceae bacterium]MCK5494990.1 helix-turn-helix transcriptional regulator [Hyphomicrobiaceae bacterium]MCK5549456.1 helix-turn-helix transcriptional regulator [Hyphomicrobiaceae bacterium]